MELIGDSEVPETVSVLQADNINMLDVQETSNIAQPKVVEQPEIVDMPEVSKLRRQHTMQRESLVLTKHPIDTLKLSLHSLLHQFRLLWVHILRHHLQFCAACLVLILSTIALAVVDGPHENYVSEVMAYLKYGLWWVGLGVASSIGLGSGLHTFVLYLGPHIAMFALKAAQCGRVDLKTAPYDTAQFGFPSTWLHQNCSHFGQPNFPRLPTEGLESYMVPVFKVLVQVQLEVILWGIGTAIGELPPYFVSRAARLSGEKVKELEDLVNLPQESDHSSLFARFKVWGFRRFSHLGFFAILLFASVPNPLFDLAGIMCGHFLVPFWKFFLATLIGKALIKTHIQTVFVILACNSHVLEALERGLGWLIVHVPVLGRLSPQILAAMGTAKEKFGGSVAVTETVKGGISVGFVWNTIVQLMMVGFVASIITATAQGFLMEQQKHEMAALVQQLSSRETQDQQDELER